jgi:hypothetical protein
VDMCDWKSDLCLILCRVHLRSCVPLFWPILCLL